MKSKIVLLIAIITFTHNIFAQETSAIRYVNKRIDKASCNDDLSIKENYDKCLSTLYWLEEVINENARFRHIFTQEVQELIYDRIEEVENIGRINGYK
ncbi:hypothetical protein [Halobacteriovorax sp. CON-3]|uniref:hypothetical protein n=1 Tax=Halobacteriovorax sp. CON-3 TaxID=3157710 RepID=UPI00372194BC